MDKGTLAMFEALYNGGKSAPLKNLIACRKSAEFKQIASSNGLISMTSINIPNKNFL